MSYWDTSTLVKLYVREMDSTAFESHALNTAGPMVTCRISLFEACATFRRKESDGLLQTATGQTLYNELLQDVIAGEIRLNEMGTGVEHKFGEVLNLCYQHTPPIPIRTLDALPLASARVARETEIVATDKRMRVAAKLLGFSLFPA